MRDNPLHMYPQVLATTFIEGFVIVTFTCGSVLQFYMLCLCLQQLRDASKDMTEEAFHEEWYRFGSSIKRTFMLMALACNLECKISTNDKFNLSLPSFMTLPRLCVARAAVFTPERSPRDDREILTVVKIHVECLFDRAILSHMESSPTLYSVQSLAFLKLRESQVRFSDYEILVSSGLTRFNSVIIHSLVLDIITDLVHLTV
ncbi:hypothetical protein EAI_08699 [Harpegnathos saltator]|uniref:Uncharacterized protein n=1 Tax=Harpegnathos saltator TaxID=610380 RepID=E2C7D4_HARSA|nr:hypothetical protein EAI_08699 [Harpegnathos saltator]